MSKTKHGLDITSRIIALWVEVLILALRDWAASPGIFRGDPPHYAAQPPKGRVLDREWFESGWCKEIVIMVGPAGLKVVRYYFLNKSHLPDEKRQKVMYLIDELDNYA